MSGSLPVDNCAECPCRHLTEQAEWCSLSDCREFSYSDKWHTSGGAPPSGVLFPSWCPLQDGPVLLGLRGDVG